MNQAELRRLIPALRVSILPRYRNLKNPDGSKGRLNIIKLLLTRLIKEERVELGHQRAHETQGYAERLISDAIRYGDTHVPTMKMADFWLAEKAYVHKLFKVIAPRFKDYEGSYTRLARAPITYDLDADDRHMKPRSVLELKGNPFPPLNSHSVPTRNWINNILMEEARREFNRKKYQTPSEES